MTDLEPDDQDDAYELAMPFLPVTSRGGPFDDAAYVAGFQMGRIDVLLSTSEALGLTPDTGLLIDAANTAQADLVAMKHGFVMTVPCRHCGDVGPPGTDHSCPCPYTDDDCVSHGLTDLEEAGWQAVTFVARVPDEPE